MELSYSFLPCIALGAQVDQTSVSARALAPSRARAEC